MKTVLKMTNAQYKQVRDFVSKKIEFALLGQVRLGNREIDVVVLTQEQYDKLRSIFNKMGLCQKETNVHK